MTAAEEAKQGPAHWREGVEQGYPRLRALAPELEQAGVAFLDLSMVFAEVEDDLYFDPCHFLPPGSKRMAADVADAVLTLLP